MHALTRRKLTYDDFLRFPDDGRRHELIDGAHHVTPSPNIAHQRVSFRLTMALGSSLQGRGEVFAAPLDVLLSDHDIVEPDLLVVLREQAPHILTDQHVIGPPAIVIEIASAGTQRRDQGIKRRLYERAGVREYWQVNPASRVITVLVRADGGFAPPVVLAEGDTLKTPLIPALNLDVRALFAPVAG